MPAFDLLPLNYLDNQKKHRNFLKNSSRYGTLKIDHSGPIWKFDLTLDFDMRAFSEAFDTKKTEGTSGFHF